jgi:C-terminal processing protease CtpA/Prc
MKSFLLPLAALAAALAGCGGGTSTPAASPGPAPAPIEQPPPPSPAPEEEKDLGYYIDRCVAKPGSTPGTVQDEQHFLRLWIDATYLWYREVPALDIKAFPTPVDYFNALKTPALTSAGRPKDRYHFSYPDARWNELSSGQQQGYGITWVKRGDGLPRDWRIATVEPQAPADKAGLRRGDRLLSIDGIDFLESTGDAVTALNAALSPHAGESHRFVLERGGERLDATLVAAVAPIEPVRNTRVIDTPNGRVGYLTFNSHIAAAEAPLGTAFATLRDAGVTDLVLDMRYNGGGLLTIASKLSYMIAGAGATAGKTFEQTIANDKTPPGKPVPFHDTSSRGTALPALNLKRVFVLAGPGTCSASESVINGLRGIDVEVHLIGGQTCGKPYAFLPTSHCGTTYFAIQYQGINAKGFGAYDDGFAPTCPVADDLAHPLGSTDEALLATALHYRAAGSCPVPPPAARSAARLPAFVPVRPEAAEVLVHDVL